jgi:hypothetical protein
VLLVDFGSLTGRRTEGGDMDAVRTVTSCQVKSNWTRIYSLPIALLRHPLPFLHSTSHPVSYPPLSSLPQDLKGLFREAQMNNAVLFFDECEVVFRTRNQGGDRLLNR